MRYCLIMFSILMLANCATPSDRPHNSLPLYKKISDLKERKYLTIGVISGSSCQITMQDLPATITDAMNNMLYRASYTEGDAVLLTQCETLNSMMGCYRLTACEGAIIKFTY